MLIVGFGDIGAYAGKILKNGFGARVIGLKRRPEITSAEHRSYADEIVGIDQLSRVIELADFVVNALPKTTDTLDFFSMKSCF